MKSEHRLAIVEDQTVEEIAGQAKMSTLYMVLMAVSGVLAAVALLESSVPILIGAMVIAPVLSPLALVAFALVGRRPGLAGHGLWVALGGLLLTMMFAVATTWILNVTGVLPAGENMLNKPLLEERVRPGWHSVIAAVAAGIAGTIAVAKEKLDTLVGVVAALALVPAASATGIAILSGDAVRASGGLGLLGINVGAIILAGVVTLLILRPDQQQ